MGNPINLYLFGNSEFSQEDLAKKGKVEIPDIKLKLHLDYLENKKILFKQKNNYKLNR